MPKWIAPADAGPGVSVGGQYFPVDKNGFVTTPDDGDYATALAPFGYVVAPDDAKPAPKAAPADPAPELPLAADDTQTEKG